MKFCVISDTHNNLETIKGYLPEADCLIHCGDLTGRGRLFEVSQELFWLKRCAAKYEYTIFIAGNHDHYLEDYPSWIKEELKDNPNIRYLNESSCVIEGIKIYGSPSTPEFNNWAFNRTSEQLYELWQNIPVDTQILVTHGPPYAILDGQNREHFGCKHQLERIQNLPNLKVNAFGHIHESYGVVDYDGVKYINACMLDLEYEFLPKIRKPIIFEL